MLATSIHAANDNGDPFPCKLVVDAARASWRREFLSLFYFTFFLICDIELELKLE